MSQEEVLLEKGVNFFVLMLEKLGAFTCFSCEGHPNGFYITFAAPVAVAVEVHACGFFNVEVAGPDYWAIRIPEYRNVTEQTRQQILTWASEAWVKAFGAIKLKPDGYPKVKKIKCLTGA